MAQETEGGIPLEGVRVLDFTQVIAGPYCTTMLADLGADVVKIERPDHGDDLRTIGRYKGREEHQDYFNANNRSKRSLVLDLKRPDSQAVAHCLAAKADVVVENFAPGTAERLGIGWPALRAVKPSLVYCSISGFGQTGPSRNRLALDPIVQAVSGIMSVTGEPDGRPMQVGAPLGDVMAGMFAAFAILGCLRAVERDGVGRRIDISMQDAMLAALGPRMGETLQAGRQPGRFGNENPMRVPADTYRTADGRHLTIICQNERYWAPLCRALGRENWVGHERFATLQGRVAYRRELNEAVTALFAERSAQDWILRLDAERIPYALVNDYAEALSDEQVVHRRTVRDLDHPTAGRIRVVGPPWIISGREAPMTSPPLLGEHGKEVIREWLGEPAKQYTIGG